MRPSVCSVGWVVMYWRHLPPLLAPFAPGRAVSLLCCVVDVLLTPGNVQFVAANNGLEGPDPVAAVRDVVLSASYMVLGLGDVYLGAPCAVPVDPRHRLVVPKYNPARTYTPEGAVGIGGSYVRVLWCVSCTALLPVCARSTQCTQEPGLGLAQASCLRRGSQPLQRLLGIVYIHTHAPHSTPPPPRPPRQMCIYPMSSPGGYQLVGRTLPIWNAHTRTGPFAPGHPWLLRNFDQAGNRAHYVCAQAHSTFATSPLPRSPPPPHPPPHPPPLPLLIPPPPSHRPCPA
jgi:hypothetical protein